MDDKVIILSIRREHAQRIFDGAKSFELRKSLPTGPFVRAYLYESGGRRVIGCFDPARVLRQKTGDLWNEVSYRATTKARFERYFQTRAEGCAIEVSKPVKFRIPVYLSDIRVVDPSFRPPMSSMAMSIHSPLAELLENRRSRERRRSGADVRVEPIRTSERAKYKRLVLRYIQPRYEGIDHSFAAGNLAVHDLGHDPGGFFTERKQVFSIWRRNEHVGFTTVTWKNNGCVKTGPTIIEPKHRRKGIGSAARRAIEQLAQQRGYRKIYCTCADDALDVAGYLLKSGMRVEAHLDRQYSGDHGELVFGKFLVADEYDGVLRGRRTKAAGEVIDIRKLGREHLKQALSNLFTQGWVPMDAILAEKVIADALSRTKPDPRRKAKRLVCVGRGLTVIGATVLLPKRGGAVKALLSTATSSRPTIRAMIEEVCRLGCSWGSRKIYFVHPLLDIDVVLALRESEFQMEGFLKAPYRRGEDVGIFSRFC